MAVQTTDTVSVFKNFISYYSIFINSFSFSLEFQFKCITKGDETYAVPDGHSRSSMGRECSRENNCPDK
jgi:hypothetical protein